MTFVLPGFLKLSPLLSLLPSYLPLIGFFLLLFFNSASVEFWCAIVCHCNFITGVFNVLFLRVIKPEEGKKLADSWGAAFMESSAKENEVIQHIFYFIFCRSLLALSLYFFLPYRPPWRFSSESYWRWRKPTGMPRQRRRSVP